MKAQLFRARELLLNILQNSEIARENEKSLASIFFYILLLGSARAEPR